MVRVLSKRLSVLVLLVAALVGGACSDDTETPAPAGPPAEVVALDFEVVEQHPHDPSAFTQGLQFIDADTIAESTGLYGRSEVRLVDPSTGEPRLRRSLRGDLFGEGLTVLPDGQLVQLTWKEGVALRWDPDGLQPAGETEYEGEGWGLAWDGDAEVLLSTDGSERISRRLPDTFEVASVVTVRRDGEPVSKLNELEWVDGVLWANVWETNELLRIDPRTGDVTGVVDLSSIDPGLRDPNAVLNGIAHRPGDPPGRLWVTGKNWPELFVIDVVEP